MGVNLKKRQLTKSVSEWYCRTAINKESFVTGAMTMVMGRFNNVGISNVWSEHGIVPVCIIS